MNTLLIKELRDAGLPLCNKAADELEHRAIAEDALMNSLAKAISVIVQLRSELTLERNK